MSRSVSRALVSLVRLLTAPMSRYGRLKTRLMVSEQLIEVIDVRGLKFYSPTARSTHDTNAVFDDAEPETIEWLDSMFPNETLWDIGANVGAFAIYAAVVRNLRVVAFEPGAASFQALVKNIEINDLSGRVDAYCLALTDETKLDYLHMADTGAGHSMHGFATTQTIDGEIDAVFRQSVPGFRADDFAEIFAPPKPDHIKLDVDGIELAILKGGAQLLRTHVKSVLVETKGHGDGADIAALLADLGFQETPSTGDEARRNTVFRKAG